MNQKLKEQGDYSSEICLSTRGIKKIYPGTIALNDVDFNIYRGKVNALVGENGAGKSTLMKIIAGVTRPNEGCIYLNGEETTFFSTRDAQQKGIGIIHQELNLFEDLTVAQNLFMTRESVKHGLMLDQKKHYQETRAVLNRLKQDIDPQTKVGNLRAGQQQIVEIAKSLLQDNLHVLIMDEPTSSLSSSEVEILFEIINDLKKEGISIVYISHRLEEIINIADYITVLRDGLKIDEKKVSEIDISWIVNKMLGREILDIDMKHKVSDQEVLRAESVTLPNPAGGYLVDHISFSLHKGEILGVYGLLGAGRTELLETLMGFHTEIDNSIYLKGEKCKISSISGQIKHGLAHIPENRQTEGLVPVLSVKKNTTLSSLAKFCRGFHLVDNEVNNGVNRMIEDLAIKVADMDLTVDSLSGGNQQKVVIGKGILTEPEVLLLDEPTRGIDVGAKEDVFRIMDELASQGLGIIFVASELKQIMAVSDRVLVMSKGKITGEFTRAEMTEEKLVRASSVGHSVEK
ncbi:sugar ABC transporter ATP-binding protein [Halocella sp. SP3-1]|uniref:sugar ABC transporter ATP-binding protein n=1 Tax=Halocella sp. SP3-1 TaxID=2382161 RepID=UPI000F7572E9|nr:sugar ABC transporter ATP-binding protein [Halocella sp. SP3-1]AZO95818.1 sugar ABC transporter ATP-binding protein [Halocella sp. SP3-1]